MMQSGEIRRIIRDRGFGFIKVGDVQQDFFFHVSELQNVSFDLLKEGQNVEFKIGLSPKGLKAASVRLAKMKL